MNSTFLEIITFLKLDLTELYLSSSSGTSLNEKKFEISPKDFLRFAKEDLKSGDERGFVNSITNSKRAIDCQIDEVLEILTFSSNNFNPLVKDFLVYYKIDSDIPIKLQIISALNLAPSLLISKSRSLRNKLEHIYQKPKIQEVKEALDVADLFIRSVAGKLAIIWTDFEISDGKDNVAKIKFNSESKDFKIEALKNEILKEYSIGEDDIEYWGFLRLMFSIDDEIEIEETFKIIIKQIGHPIPAEKISILSND